MVEIKIDEDVCKNDGLCAMTCPRGILVQEEQGTIPSIVDTFLEKCFLCGQCVAICPHGAISHSHFPAGSVHPIKSENVPSYDQVLELIRGRRSKRFPGAVSNTVCTPYPIEGVIVEGKVGDIPLLEGNPF